MTALALRRVSWEHPEVPAAIFAAGGWAFLLAPSTGRDAAHLHAHQGAPWLAGTAGWLVMCIAMMVPAALPHVRYLALSAMWYRRQWTIAVFLGSYLSVWMAFGFVAVSSVEWAQRLFDVGAAALLAVALFAAALWEFTPWKWRSLRACHIATPLPPRGVKADVACAAAGLRYGRLCLVACWPLMLAMAVAVHEHVALMALLSLIVFAEKVVVRASRLGPTAAAVLLGAALVVLAS